ncbi:MAG: branched-chain amino acid ABC transporter permease [Alphaproteobacteria bacterium]|jgi:branched-chain amino acid transport system permease protein|nr:branched-chain amino acid ABC transporter permease [Alphaproteobacteria bacterium]MBT4017085.1 branched-chain amino acid ABC transporter permease [Alphaproteobacteria bacterium]MBT4546065.1 branched-chain amino acid ABC transporter permease [Alphaproteobacteria bacterium]MBT5918331.1 branched-chain amino acid ABC transporter permease [Alphaproteobacteria bacterium]MBT6385512.1 branched-chain amino acid ABC transporter permease [Alphaproteobacteria bacterium]
MTSRETRTLVIAVILFGLAALLPFSGNGYYISIGVTIAMYVVLSTSWALFSGPTHYISLATAAFYGLGTMIVATGIEMVPYVVLLLISAVAGAVMAALVGLATLRLSGVYFVIFTLGLAEMIRQLVSWLQNNLGGSRGLYVLTDLTEEHIYWELLALAGFVFLIGWWIGRSRLGFAMRIIGNDETVAAHCGINTARSKILLFMVSGMVAALVGALLAPRWTYIEPNIAFSPLLSFEVVIMALLGGTKRLWGPLVGVIPFTILLEVIEANYPSQTILVLGIAFLLIVYLVPHGVVGRLEQSFAKFRKGGN